MDVSIASQQKVIEQHQATITSLRRELAQANANLRSVSTVYNALVDMCDEHEAAGLKAIPVTTLRGIRPQGQGLGGGQAPARKKSSPTRTHT